MIPGTCIGLVDPLRFANGETYARFIVEKPRRALRFRADDGALCAIRGIADLDWSIVTDGAENAAS